MKKLLSFCLLLSVMFTASAQKKMFVRVFDENWKRTHKGFLQQMTDSSVSLKQYGETVEIPVEKIGMIKLKRSGGHTVLMSSLIVGGAAAIFGAISADPDAWIFGYSAVEGFGFGLGFGAAAGAIPGGIIAGTQRKPFFIIDKSREKWAVAKNVLQRFLPADKY